jgi:hypothetical protein
MAARWRVSPKQAFKVAARVVAETVEAAGTPRILRAGHTRKHGVGRRGRKESASAKEKEIGKKNLQSRKRTLPNLHLPHRLILMILRCHLPRIFRLRSLRKSRSFRSSRLFGMETSMAWTGLNTSPPTRSFGTAR